MMGRSELVALDLDDVTETADGLELTVRASKTDQDARGAVVAVPRGQHPDSDPVRLLRDYRAALAQRGITDGRCCRRSPGTATPARSCRPTPSRPGAPRRRAGRAAAPGAVQRAQPARRRYQRTRPAPR
jgi:hypothetical protein